VEDILDIAVVVNLIFWMGEADPKLAPVLWTLVLMSAVVMYVLDMPTRPLTQEEKDEWFGRD